MCTLTYRLHETGYELFFNRDEQRSRAQAVAPKLNSVLKAIYPVDPIGKGTWIAVHESGLSLTLLNYYQAEKTQSSGTFYSRGEIILKLLENADNVVQSLQNMPLKHYQAFQICIFPADLSLGNNALRCFFWDGFNLVEKQHSLPITSSGVDYEQVYQARKVAFEQQVSSCPARSQELFNYHQSTQSEGKLSVQMSRKDAKTVSLSRICVAQNIEFEYLDYNNDKQKMSLLNRLSE